MKTFLSKKKFFLSLLFFYTVIMVIIFIIPLSKKVMEYVQLYSQAFIEPFPEIKIHADKIEFLDPVPVKFVISDSVEIICDTLYDENYFAGCPEKSVFLSEKNIYLKIADGVEQIDIASLNIQNNETNIVKEEIRTLLERYAKIILQVITIVIMILLYLVLILITTLGAGIGFIVDAFENGKFNFIQLLNISSILLTVFLVLICVLYIFNVLSIKILLINIVLFFLFIAVTVYYLSKFSRFLFYKI